MGTDLGLALSFAADANSGLQGNNKFGDIIAGAKKTPQWIWLAVLGGALVLGVLWIVRR